MVLFTKFGNERLYRMKLINVTTNNWMSLTEKAVNFDGGMKPGIVLYKRKIKLCCMKKNPFSSLLEWYY